MAEFTHNRLQEAKPIKGGVTYNTPSRRSYDTPNQMAGYAEEQKSKAWDATSKGIAAMGFVGAKLREGQERLMADKIKEEMNQNHLTTMTTLARDLPNTEIGNLDFDDIRWGFYNRHSEDFKIGKSDAHGKPSILVKDKSIDDYDLPATQKEELRKHYKGLEQSTQDWLVDNLQAIQKDKDTFYLAKMSSDAVDKIDQIFRDSSKYVGGTDEVWFQDPETGELTKEGKDKVNPILGKTPITNELGALWQHEIDKILSDFDKEIVKRMDAGTLNLEEASAYFPKKD